MKKLLILCFPVLLLAGCGNDNHNGHDQTVTDDATTQNANSSDAMIAADTITSHTDAGLDSGHHASHASDTAH